MKLFALFALTSSLFLSLAQAQAKSGTLGRKKSERIQGEPFRGVVRKPTPPPKRAEDLRRGSIFNDDTIAKIIQEKQNKEVPSGRPRSKSIADIIQDLKEDPELMEVTKRFASQSSLQDSGAKQPSMEKVKEFLDSPDAKVLVDRIQTSVQGMLGEIKPEEIRKLREESQAMFAGLKIGEEKASTRDPQGTAPDMDALMNSPEKVAMERAKSILKDEKALESFRKLTEKFLTPKLKPTNDQKGDTDNQDDKKNNLSALDKILKGINLNLDDFDMEKLLNASKKAPKSYGKRHERRQSSDYDDFTESDDDSWFGGGRHMDRFL